MFLINGTLTALNETYPQTCPQLLWTRKPAD